MAKKLPIDRNVELSPELAAVTDCYTSDETDGTPRVSLWDGQRRLVDYGELRGFLKERDTGAVETAISLFTAHSTRPEHTQEMLEDFVYRQLGSRVALDEERQGSPLVFHGVTSPNNDEVMSVLSLSARSASELAMIVAGNLVLFDTETELRMISRLAMEAYVTTAYAWAMYGELQASRWIQHDSPNVEIEYLRRQRIAKSLATAVLSLDEKDIDMSTLRLQLFGGILYDQMMTRLLAHDFYYDDTGISAIERRRETIGQNAFQATGDGLFLGFARPLSEQDSQALIALCVNNCTPRIA